jgi:hypothetical protein
MAVAFCGKGAPSTSERFQVSSFQSPMQLVNKIRTSYSAEGIPGVGRAIARRLLGKSSTWHLC